MSNGSCMFNKPQTIYQILKSTLIFGHRRNKKKCRPAQNFSQNETTHSPTDLILSPESVIEACSVVLTFKSVDEILWCDHPNETSSTGLLHGSILFQYFKDQSWDFSWILILGVNELKLETLHNRCLGFMKRKLEYEGRRSGRMSCSLYSLALKNYWRPF